MIEIKTCDKMQIQIHMNNQSESVSGHNMAGGKTLPNETSQVVSVWEHGM